MQIPFSQWHSHNSWSQNYLFFVVSVSKHYFFLFMSYNLKKCHDNFVGKTVGSPTLYNNIPIKRRLFLNEALILFRVKYTFDASTILQVKPLVGLMFVLSVGFVRLLGVQDDRVSSVASFQDAQTSLRLGLRTVSLLLQIFQLSQLL